MAELWMWHIPLKQRMSALPLKNKTEMELLSMSVLLCPCFGIFVLILFWKPLSALPRMCGYWITHCRLFPCSYSDTVMAVFKIIWDFLSFGHSGTCWLTRRSEKVRKWFAEKSPVVVWFWTVCVELCWCDWKSKIFSAGEDLKREDESAAAWLI